MDGRTKTASLVVATALAVYVCSESLLPLLHTCHSLKPPYLRSALIGKVKEKAQVGSKVCIACLFSLGNCCQFQEIASRRFPSLRQSSLLIPSFKVQQRDTKYFGWARAPPLVLL